MRTQLFIENFEIELNEGVQFLLNKEFEHLSNPTDIINDWSKTVSIPFTEKNNKIFGYIYNPNRVIVSDGTETSYTKMGIYFDPTKKLDFRLVYNNFVLMEGYAKMLDIKMANYTGTYNITLNGQLGKIFQELKKITFDTTTEDTNYLIHGEDYVEEYIDRNLVYNSWTGQGQTHTNLMKKDNVYYNVNDIIGWAPNNSFSEGFDYKSFQHNDPSIGMTIKKFTEVLENKGFLQATNISPDTAIPNGMLPREIGEYRSYLQLPFIYWNKLFQMFQTKAEEITGYTFDLDETFFTPSNPDWYNLVYILKTFNTKKSEGATNYYNPHIYDITWIGSTNTDVYESQVMIPTTTEAFGLVEDFDTYPSIFVITNKDEVYINYSLGLELHDNGSSDPYSLRLHKDNYMNIKVDLLDSNDNILKTESYAICDYECSYMDEIKNDYKQENILIYNELTRTGEYPQRLQYITINPTFTYMLKSYKGLEYKFRIYSNWKYTTYRFMTKYTSSDSYVGTTPNTVLKYSNNSLISAQLSLEMRSNSYFILNDLWNKDFNLFSEILRYCKMYRIYVYTDDYAKKIYFKQYDKYFEDYSIEDWTNKLDRSKEILIKPITFENKYVLFNYEDNKTKLGNEYRDKYGFDYGEYRLTTDYNFNIDTAELFKDTNLKTSIMSTDNVLSWTNLYDNSKIVYSFPAEIYIYNKDKDNKQVDTFGCFYYHNGLATFDTELSLYMRPVKITDDTILQEKINTFVYSQGYNYANVTTYPKLDVVYGDNLCLFNTPKENYTYLNNYSDKATIYSRYWEKYLNERYNIQNKVVTCYLTLTSKDWTDFRFNKFIKIDGVLYMVNKIYDYNIETLEPTKVDLITITDIKGYTE